MLQSMGSQRAEHNPAAEQRQRLGAETPAEQAAASNPSSSHRRSDPMVSPERKGRRAALETPVERNAILSGGWDGR